MLIAPALGGSERAAVTIGLVLTEALVLYVGYGALMQITGPVVREMLASL
ncbi:DUF7512 family protein [Halosolutus halophilus]